MATIILTLQEARVLDEARTVLRRVEHRVATGDYDDRSQPDAYSAGRVVESYSAACDAVSNALITAKVYGQSDTAAEVLRAE